MGPILRTLDEQEEQQPVDAITMPQTRPELQGSGPIPAWGKVRSAQRFVPAAFAGPQSQPKVAAA